LNKREKGYLERTIDNFLNIEKCEGTVTAVKIAKENLRLVSRFILEQSTKKQLGPRWISTDQRGIPSYLQMKQGEKTLLRSNPMKARIILTILSFYKLVKTKPDYSIKTITDPCASLDVGDTISRITKMLPKVLKTLKVTPFQTIDKYPLHVTTKAGGHGPAAMGVTSLFDLASIQAEEVYPKVTEMLDLVLTKSQHKVINGVTQESLEAITSDITEHIKSSARLHFISEGGGKTRVVCIGDIWTQIALKPIHEKLMGTLKGITWDGTSSHNTIATKLSNWTVDEEFYCYDLTAATDRMPIQLQIEVLKPIFGERITELWSQLLIDRDIECRGETVRYAVGQPMGFLSSWAAMALTHHVIINYCYECAGVKPQNRRYVVIGDDMAISNKRAAEIYVQTLSELGMEISQGKSITPNKEGVNCAEIAKRYFKRGIELSPVTPDQICLGTNSLTDLLNLDRTLSDRSYYQNGRVVGGMNSCPGGLDRKRVLNSFLKKIKKEELLSACVYLTSPLFSGSVDLSTGADITSPISRVKTGVWDRVFGFNHRYEGFLLGILSHRIIGYEADKASARQSGLANQERYSPIVDSYFTKSIKDMQDIINVYNVSYDDEEGDSNDLLDQTDPKFVLEEILSRPNPLDKPLFQRKFAREVKQSESFLMEFIRKERMVKIPDLSK
jgi:hypothetical protein